MNVSVAANFGVFADYSVAGVLDLVFCGHFPEFLSGFGGLRCLRNFWSKRCLEACLACFEGSKRY